jgi:PHP family Zn ribbon phosphoesterase
VKPTYYKVLWHNCNRCKTHYTSEAPHLKAYLCDDCWGAIPHFQVKSVQTLQRKVMKKKDKQISWKDITLYTIGNILCLGVIAYYLWFK